LRAVVGSAVHGEEVGLACSGSRRPGRRAT
jgi:hypothetical protein